jgi:drug/metabolite transporter (DMT)-like permease
MVWVHLALFSVAILYGANYTIAKFALPEFIKPFGFIAIRLISATTLFWAVDSIRPSEKIDRKDHWLLIKCGFFGAGINMLLFFEGLSLTTPIHGSIIMTMSPIAVLIVAAFMGREKLTVLKSIGTAVGFVGAFLLLTRHGFSFSEGTFLGDLMILGNSITYAVYLVIVKPLMKKYRPFTVLKWVFLYGTLLCLPFGFTQLLQVEWATFTSEAWFSVFYVVFGSTFAVYLINAWALSHVQSSTVGAYIYLQPVIAAIVALSLGRDTLDTLTVVYALIIMIGVYLVSKRKRIHV